jgi:hypothetical protein
MASCQQAQGKGKNERKAKQAEGFATQALFNMIESEGGKGSLAEEHQEVQ